MEEEEMMVLDGQAELVSFTLASANTLYRCFSTLATFKMRGLQLLVEKHCIVYVYVCVYVVFLPLPPLFLSLILCALSAWLFPGADISLPN